MYFTSSFFSFIASRSGDVSSLETSPPTCCYIDFAVSVFAGNLVGLSATLFPVSQAVSETEDGGKRRRSPGKLCPRRHQHRKVATRRAPFARESRRKLTASSFLLPHCVSKGAVTRVRSPTRRRSYSAPYKFCLKFIHSFLQLS